MLRRQLEDAVVQSTEVPEGTMNPCAETLTVRHLPAKVLQRLKALAFQRAR